MRFLTMLLAAGAAFAGVEAAAEPLRPVQLSRVVVDLEPGARIGKYKGGSICFAGDKFLWKRGSAPELDADDFEDAFRATIPKLGFKSIDDAEDLFAGVDTGGAEYLVAAKIDAILVNVCYPNQGLGSVEKSKGRATVRVTWQIYSREQRTVIATFTATGAAARAESAAGGPHAILMAAFADSLRQFTAQPSFAAVYGSASAR